MLHTYSPGPARDAACSDRPRPGRHRPRDRHGALHHGAALADRRRQRHEPAAARDGHSFIPDAIAKGASAILQTIGRPIPEGDITVVAVSDTLTALHRLARYARNQCHGPVVSITGSNGKTTTTSLIYHILKIIYSTFIISRNRMYFFKQIF